MPPLILAYARQFAPELLVSFASLEASRDHKVFLSPPPRTSGQLPHRWYVDQGRTLEQIAGRQHTSKGVVREWLTGAGIPVKPRTSREHRKHLDPVLIAELYQESEWSSAQIAAQKDVTVNLVLRTLHDRGVPVRRGGPPPRHPADEVEPRLTPVHRPRDHRAPAAPPHPASQSAGHHHRALPHSRPVTEALLREAYVDIGLATTHIEQLTGQPMERILSLMRAHAIPVRPPSFSPSLVRQREQSRTQNLGSKRAGQALIRRR